MPPRRGRTRAQDLRVLERRQYVYDLRASGASYHRIAQAIHADARWTGRLPTHYNERHVHHDVMTELTRRRTELAEQVDAVRQQELERLDRLQLAVWARALAGENHAISLVLDIMTRRARYLAGLEAPTRIAPTTPDGKEPYDPQAALRDLEATFARLAQAQAPGTPNTEPPHDDTPTAPDEPGAAMGAPLP